MKYEIAEIYLIKDKSKSLSAANLKVHLYDKLLFSITYFSSFWNTVIHLIKAKCKINKIYVIKVKYRLLVIANLLLLFYAQLPYNMLFVFLGCSCISRINTLATSSF